ncbi:MULTISPECIES: hypothetical protein [Enterococcus]|uniref:Uncharacterized protein n=1 Tax=Candidatus Enterococcus ferrettii TaxID=2815324 RepID=A0ABV0EU66_9ENTE|nr:hypothetical protein [Enterococcus sp. 665A]MBO1339512.1 hypothetical protein [Enterococcus sp. 665A]
MKSLFEEINDRMLGEVGQSVLTFLIQHKLLFLVLFACYGSLLLYSKVIYMYYIPGRIKQIILMNPGLPVKKLSEIWKQEKKKLPWYILIPSKNERWVKLASQSNGEYQLLYFNRKSSYASEQTMIENLYENLKGDFHLG